MADGSIEPAPIWDDIKTLKAEHFDVKIDIILGGFPCQDISVAGRGEGIVEGNRSGLFYEVLRLAKEIKPTFLFLENVPAIRTRGLDIVIQELTQIGYDLRWTMLSASEIGAPHRRERWFALAYRRNSASPNDYNHGWTTTKITDCNKEAVCNSENRENGSVHASRLGSRPTMASTYLSSDYWSSESGLVRVVDGVPFGVDRIKRLGNAVVPLQAKTAFEYLMFGTEPQDID